MTQKILVESLSMDLLRVALGLHRGSHSMAERFREEAIKREQELEDEKLQGYLKKLVDSSKRVLADRSERTAEDALMYSVLFQNFARRYYNS